jgi:hypothetical protein
MHLARRSHSECSEIYRRNNDIAVPGFILPGARVGAPDRMKPGTPMSLFAFVISDHRYRCASCSESTGERTRYS